MSRPRRLPGVSSVGPARYFLTICTQQRRRAFLDESAAVATISHFRRTAHAEGFAVLAYCLMPDHIHLLVEGMTDRSDFRRFVKQAKQRSGAAYALRFGKPLWQEGSYERVLRADTDAREAARYILWNPVRAGIAPHPVGYPHLGSDVWPVQQLLEA